jgi:DNA-binding HxlR family transcriptional regulator
MTRSIKNDTDHAAPSTARGKYARTGYVSPIDATLEVIGGKYKVAVLFHLKDGVRRFGELRRLVPTATQRMLTTQLRELERDALITRKVFAEVPPRVDYALSAEGKSLLPILTAMCEWGKRRIKTRQKAAAGGSMKKWESLATRIIRTEETRFEQKGS